MFDWFDTIGYEVRTLDNLPFRMLLAYSAKAGMDELTMMHGWIIGYLYDNREKEILSEGSGEEVFHLQVP